MELPSDGTTQHPRVQHGVSACLPAADKTVLQHLDVSHCWLADEAAWQHMFAANKQLTALTTLNVADTIPPMTATSVGALAQACPVLVELHLCAERGERLSALRQLTALTYLEVNGPTDEVCADLAALAVQLSALRTLYIECPWPVTAAGLLQLTARTQLTKLVLNGPLDSDKVSRAVIDRLRENGLPPAARDGFTIVNKVRLILLSHGLYDSTASVRLSGMPCTGSVSCYCMQVVPNSADFTFRRCAFKF